MIDGVLPHERSDIVSSNRRILKDGLHLGEMIFELEGDADVAFDHAEQRAVDNCGDDLLLRHLPFLTGWRITFTLPRLFPHFDHVDVPSKVGRVLFRVGQKHRHGLAVHGVDFLGIGVALWAAVKIAAVELVSRMRFRTPPVNRKLPNSLLAAISLMTDAETRSLRFPIQPLDSHLPERLCLLWTESVLLSSTRMPTGGHILH